MSSIIFIFFHSHVRFFLSNGNNRDISINYVNYGLYQCSAPYQTPLIIGRVRIASLMPYQNATRYRNNINQLSHFVRKIRVSIYT
jgi:hypothetical protein